MQASRRAIIQSLHAAAIRVAVLIALSAVLVLTHSTVIALLFVRWTPQMAYYDPELAMIWRESSGATFRIVRASLWPSDGKRLGENGDQYNFPIKALSHVTRRRLDMQPLAVDPVQGAHDEVGTLTLGWPLRCVYCTWIGYRGELRSGFSLDSTLWSGTPFEGKVIPYAVDLSQCCVNVLSYCFMLCIVRALFLSAMRHRRVSAGRCRFCNYDLRGIMCASCPECGRAIRPTAQRKIGSTSKS